MLEKKEPVKPEHLIETYKSLIQLGTFGLKFIQIVNGGAAIALLAYLGNVTKSGGEAPDLVWPMTFFIIGLILGGLATVTAYLTQLHLYNEGLGVVQSGEHKLWLWASIGLCVLGLASFAVGSLTAAKAFVG